MNNLREKAVDAIYSGDGETMRAMLAADSSMVQWRDLPRHSEDRRTHGDTDDQMLLHLAVSCGDERIVQMLLDAGANPLLRDNEGRNPLWFALFGASGWRSLPHMIAPLIKAGADPNVPPELKPAASTKKLCNSAVEKVAATLWLEKDPSEMEILISSGAREDIPSHEGLLPREIALVRKCSMTWEIACTGLDFVPLLIQAAAGDEDWWKKMEKHAREFGAKFKDFRQEIVEALGSAKDEARQFADALIKDPALLHTSYDEKEAAQLARGLCSMGMFGYLFESRHWQGRGREMAGLLEEISALLPPRLRESLDRQVDAAAMIRNIEATVSIASLTAARRNQKKAKE